MRPYERSEDGLLGQSPAFLEVLDQVSQLARLDRPALVIGVIFSPTSPRTPSVPKRVLAEFDTPA